MVARRWNFLINKINEHQYTTGAEIGVQAGKTFKQIVEKCPNVTLYGVDVWVADKNVRLKEQDLEGAEYHPNYNRLKNYIDSQGLADRAIMIRSYSDGCLDQFDDNSLDFVFIDADHSYEGVRNDTLNWSKKVKEGGLIAGHDSNFPGISKWLKQIDSNLQVQREVGFNGKMRYAEDSVWWYYKRQW